MIDDLENVYTAKATHYRKLADQKKIQLRIIALARFGCFTALFPILFYVFPLNSTLALSLTVALLVTFLFLVRRFIDTEKQHLFYLALEEINRNELAALARNFKAFNAGTDFINSQHDFSLDLDLYGDGSLFQFLNRTETGKGRQHLSEVLNKTQRSAHEIRSRQTAIEELAAELDWRQHFLAKGKETDPAREYHSVETMHPIGLKSANVIRWMLFTLPPITISVLVLYIFGIITSSLLLAAIVPQWILFIAFGKTLIAFKRQFENQSRILEKYAGMLRHIEDKTFRTPLLLNLKQKLRHKNETAASIIKKLQKILHEFEYRQNILIGFVLNSLFMWDIRCIYRLFRWQQAYAKDLPEWFDVIAETDALISLANCNYNHTSWVIPEIKETGFELSAKSLGHPLIDQRRCVTNDFRISGGEKLVIITGANMAGKSTFLRTVGVNLILASAGCRVCAETFRFSPVRVFTNMRTTDNLMNDESYFYAELLRLQTILDLLRKGENLFVILDEMLKGTNSVDKLNGSKELIKQLISLDTHGLVATHDLGLTELTGTYPTELKNQCFEVKLTEEELSFDYKLTNGVTQTMNATFLMKKMGIISSKK